MRDVNYVGLLKEFRRRRGLTQEEVARELGVTFATVNAWENGRRKPMPFLARRLLQMAEQAGMDVPAIVQNDDREGGEDA